jgi:hypothetical protein
MIWLIYTLQDLMNAMYSGTSVTDRGTLFFIKNRFGHRSVKKNVMENTNHVYDLLTFTVEGMICLLALQLLDITTLDAVPSGFKSDDPAALQDLASRIVDIIWPSIDYSSIQQVISATGGDDDDLDQDEEEGVLLCVCQIASSDGKKLFLAVNCNISKYKHAISIDTM